jgi:thiol-disulfide isomerase/thioredoxin
MPYAAFAADGIKESAPLALPDITFSGKDGKSQAVDAGKNKLTALHFWATWCKPCIEELPQLDAAQKQYESKGFRVIALSLDGKDISKVEKFFADNKIESLKLFMDSDMSAFQKLKIHGLPTTIFINSKGEEIARSEGTVTWGSSETKEFIEKQLK